MTRIYVASSWRNNFQSTVVESLRLDGHEVYDFKNPAPDERGFHWSEIDVRWKEWTPASFRESLDHPLARGGFLSDFEAMQWADTCVLVLPCGRSAHLEAGWFIGSGRSLYILMLDQQEPELMYRMATRVCVSINEVRDALLAVGAVS